MQPALARARPLASPPGDHRRPPSTCWERGWLHRRHVLYLHGRPPSSWMGAWRWPPTLPGILRHAVPSSRPSRSPACRFDEVPSPASRGEACHAEPALHRWSESGKEDTSATAMRRSVLVGSPTNQSTRCAWRRTILPASPLEASRDPSRRCERSWGGAPAKARRLLGFRADQSKKMHGPAPEGQPPLPTGHKAAVFVHSASRTRR